MYVYTALARRSTKNRPRRQRLFSRLLLKLNLMFTTLLLAFWTTVSLTLETLALLLVSALLLSTTTRSRVVTSTVSAVCKVVKNRDYYV